MSGLLNVKIFVENGIPQIPSGIWSLDVSKADEGEIFNIERYYTEKYQIHPNLEIYSAQNPIIINFAKDQVADQRIQFIYKIEGKKYLFISDDKVFLNFMIK